MTLVKVIDEAAEDRRQRRIIITMFTLGFLGGGYLVYDYMQILNHTRFPESIKGIDAIVQQWKADGLVESIDVKNTKLVVVEPVWNSKNREEKVGIITQLARYCAEKNGSGVWALSVVSERSPDVLGEIGKNGLQVN